MKKTSTAQEVVTIMRDYCSGLNTDADAVMETFTQYMNNDETYRKEWADYLGIRGLNILSMSGSNDFYYFMTFLLHATNKPEVLKALLKYCIIDDLITKEDKFFLYYQLVGYNFLNPVMQGEGIANLMDDLYSKIYFEYKKELGTDLDFITKDKRNTDFIMVLVSQVLMIEHAPTRMLLEHCYILEKHLNKKVYIINTAELMSQNGKIPCFYVATGSYNEDYNEIQELSWKDSNFAFIQCPNRMPDVAIIKEILHVVKSEKPWFVLNIGGNSIVSDLCSNIVPTLTLGTVSGRSTTRGQFQTMARKINDDDRKWLKKHHMPEEAIIECRFTSVLKEQMYHFKRKDLGLPEGRFVAVLVGSRLDQEIDSECMALLEKLVAAGIFIAFVGKFDRYKEYTDKNSAFGENTAFLGFQEDTLAVDEVCDLYINPKRVGGGTSAVEAICKGLPVVTFDFGDVGAGVGADFHVKDYDDMYNQVLRYADDRDYYVEMSQKAKERAAQLTDSTAEFMRIVHIMEQSERF